MSGTLVFFVMVMASSFSSGLGRGNHFPCSVNYCQNSGMCTVMTPSPTIQAYKGPDRRGYFETTLCFFLSPKFSEWQASSDYCEGKGGFLFSLESNNRTRKAVQELERFFVRKGLTEHSEHPEEKTQYFWSGSVEHPSQKQGGAFRFCQLVKVEEKRDENPGAVPSGTDLDISVVSNTCDTKYFIHDPKGVEPFETWVKKRIPGICAKDAKTSGTDLVGDRKIEKYLPEEDPKNDFIYTCQCKRNYVGENCTHENDADIGLVSHNAYCQVSEAIQIEAGADDLIIFVDHVLYGRPFIQEDYLIPQPFKSEICKIENYAFTEDEFCVARNSLAAMTYWCQAKSSCSFTKSALEDAANFKMFFVQTGNLNSFDVAREACRSQGGELAQFRTEAELYDAVKGHAMLFEKKNITQLWTNDARGCRKFLANLNETDNVAGWFETAPECWKFEQTASLCETGFAGYGPMGSPYDSSCLNNIDFGSTMVEYRFHLEKNLNISELSCPEGVHFRRGNTCYKKTNPMSWSEARRQCWVWGGELAFPLPSESCTFRSYISDVEQLWMASSTPCGHERCEIFFSSQRFIEGTYDSSNDICFPDPSIDRGCQLGFCHVDRRGLCALPPARRKRTRLPLGNRLPCQPAGASNMAQWPYENWSWDLTGKPGETSIQQCPPDLSGYASWYCSPYGMWEGLPDLSNCVKIDVGTALDALEEEDSVPADVILQLYRDVSQEELIGGGDLKNIIIVLEKALKVQNDHLQNESDAPTYATTYTEASSTMINDILKRPTSWLGIPLDLKREALTQVQVNLDGIAESLVKHSNKMEQEFSYDSLALKVTRGPETRPIFMASGSTIEVIVEGGFSSERSFSFTSLPTFDCIINERTSCSTRDFNVTVPLDGVINSPVLGSVVFDEDLMKVSSGLEVMVHLKHFFNGDDYNISDPQCVFWKEDINTWDGEGCEMVEHTDSYTKCRCNHLTNFAVLMDLNGMLSPEEALYKALTWMTIVGCSLSIISLVICLYVFTRIKGLRGDRTSIHRNLCLSLLVAEILLLSGLDATNYTVVCSVVAGFLHFWFLAAFGWMLVEGIHVYLMLVKVFDTAHSMMWRFYVLGYGIPAAIVLLSALISETSGRHGYGTDDHCWLSTENGMIWAFAGPVGVVMVINTAMFIKALVIARTSLKKRSDNLDSLRATLTLFKGSYSLMCILGLTWIFGFTYFENGSQWLSVVFTILNSTQGVFILVFHVMLNEKARTETEKHGRHTLKGIRDRVTMKMKSKHQDTSTPKPTEHNRTKFSNSTATTSLVGTGSGSNTGNEESHSSGSEHVKYYRGNVTMLIKESS